MNVLKLLTKFLSALLNVETQNSNPQTVKFVMTVTEFL